MSFSITDESGDAHEDNKRYSRDSEGKFSVLNSLNWKPTYLLF